MNKSLPISREKVPKKQKKIRDEYETKEVGKLVQKGLSQDQSEKIVRHRLDGNLAPGDQIRSDKYGWIDVSELLINPEKYDGETFSDPLEPDYGGGRNKAKFLSIVLKQGGVASCTLLHMEDEIFI